MKEVLFYRTFKKYQGGHLKVWDYFLHVLSSPNHTAKVRFSRDSVWDERNPWRDMRDYTIDPDTPANPDMLLLDGRDWEKLSEEERGSSRIPILNLIQHVRHGFEDNPRYAFLRHRAIRICNSEETAESIRSTGRVNGPIFTIPYGLEVECFPEPIPFSEKDLDFLIVAIKQPRLGRRLKRLLWRPGRRNHLLVDPVLRREFLDLMNRARVSVFLPHETEGFYIPALEGMALDTLVVCPDCVGNRSFCLPDHNCFRPELSTAALRTAAEAARRLAPSEVSTYLANARETFARHDLMRERKDFLEILGQVDQLW
jgi:glycosyltransferase involved in cell wall biosynthesis